MQVEVALSLGVLSQVEAQRHGQCGRRKARSGQGGGQVRTARSTCMARFWALKASPVFSNLTLTKTEVVTDGLREHLFHRTVGVGARSARGERVRKKR